MLKELLGAAAGAVLVAAAPALRARGIEPSEVARRLGLRVIELDDRDLRAPHDLAG